MKNNKIEGWTIMNISKNVNESYWSKLNGTQRKHILLFSSFETREREKQIGEKEINGKKMKYSLS